MNSSITKSENEKELESFKKDLPFGEILKVHNIGNFQIVESLDHIPKDSPAEKHFYIYMNCKSIGRFDDYLDTSLLVAIAYKYTDCNSQAPEFIAKMLGLNEEMLNKLNIQKESSKALYYGKLVCDNEIVGKAVSDNKKDFYLLPPAYGTYYCSELSPLSKNWREATDEEKIKFYVKSYPWGKVKQVHRFGDFFILEALDRPAANDKDQSYRTCFHVYYDFKDMSCSTDTLDKALLIAIADKYEGTNSYAAEYIFRVLGIK